MIAAARNHYARSWLLLCCSAIMITGCSTLPATVFRSEFLPAHPGLKVVRRTQQIRISRGEFAMDLLGVLETSAARTSLAVLNPTGMLLFSIEQTVDGETVERTPDIPGHVDPRQVLADVRMVNWRGVALRHALTPGVDLRETDNTRELIRNDRTLSLARFTPNLQYWRSAVLDNHRFGYRLEVTQLNVETL